MHWIAEDNMVNGLFFCATLTSRRRDGVAPLRRSSAGWVPAKVGRLSAGADLQCSHNICLHVFTARKIVSFSLKIGPTAISTNRSFVKPNRQHQSASLKNNSPSVNIPSLL